VDVHLSVGDVDVHGVLLLRRLGALPIGLGAGEAEMAVLVSPLLFRLVLDLSEYGLEEGAVDALMAVAIALPAKGNDEDGALV